MNREQGIAAGAARTAIRTTWVSIAGNAVLALLKWLSGFFGNSYALIADAIESTTDILASLLVLLGLRYASRPADDDHPYGHGRAEPLVTFLVVAFLTVSAAVIAWQAVVNIRTPHQLPEPWTLVVLGAIIGWKEASYRWVMRRARNTGSTALVAEAWHHRSDAITSVAAFIGIALARLLGPGHEAADDWAALLAAGFILFNAYKILRPALGEVMDEQTHHALIERIRAVAATVPGVRATEKCWVRKTGMKYHVDLHAHVDGGISVRQGHHIAHALQDALLRELPELGRVLVHIEPDGD